MANDFTYQRFDRRIAKEHMKTAVRDLAVIAERKAIAHIMRLLEEWGQLDIKGFPLVQAMVDKLEAGETCSESRRSRSMEQNTDDLLGKTYDSGFKAGQQLALEKQGLAYVEGQQAGRREVVEWVNFHTGKHTDHLGFKIRVLWDAEWQAKVKKWEVSEPSHEEGK